MTRTTPWRGALVADRLGVTVVDDPVRSVLPVRDLVGMALRRNPRRAHLLVSTVLAKHVPTRPWVAVAAGELLGLAVAARLAVDRPGGSAADGPATRCAEAVRTVAALLHAALGAEAVDTAAVETAAVCTTALGAAAAGPAAVGVVSSPVPDGTWTDCPDDRATAATIRAAVDAVRADARADVVTIGFAETATGLGSLVAGVLGGPTIHSTRLDPLGATVLTGFEESHSHATDHRLLPSGPLLVPGGTVVLVDDDLSTGATFGNAIRALHRITPQSTWVVAALVDLRGPEDRARLDALSDELGAAVSVVALGSGVLTLPAAAADLARGVVDELDGAHADGGAAGGSRADGTHADDQPANASPADASGVPGSLSPGAPPAASVAVLDLSGALPPVRSDRFGTRGGVPADRVAAVTGAVADRVGVALRAADHHGTPARVLVLGTEEHIALPLAVAAALDDRLPGATVRFSTTTRSPIVPADRPDYAVASAVTFASHDRTLDGPGRRHAYNLVRGGAGPDVVVVLPEPGTDPTLLDGDDGLVAALRRHTRDVLVVQLAAEMPTGRTSA